MAAISPALRTSDPSGVAAPTGHFSHAVVVRSQADLLFVSGQVPRDASGRSVGAGDMSLQAEQVFANLRAILDAHGAGFGDVAKLTIYVTRMDLAGEVAAVRARHCGAHRPASTLVGVAALKQPEWWLEVELVAALPAAREAG